MKKRLDSKSALGEYMGVVYDVAGYLAVNAGMVRGLLAHLEEVGVTAEATHCSELLVVLAKHSPQVISDLKLKIEVLLADVVFLFSLFRLSKALCPKCPPG